MKKIFFVLLLVVLVSGCAESEDKNPNDEITDSEQIDYVELLRDYNSNNNNTLKAQVISNQSFWVYQPISHEKYVGHLFEKNKNDDFILYSSSVIGTFENNSFISENYVMAGSNKEFAYRARPKDSPGKLYWFPEHENVGTTFANVQNLYFDNVEQDLNIPGNIIDVETVTIKQELEFIYPETSLSLAELFIDTEISQDGVSYAAHGQWLEDTEIERGYVAMLPTVTPLMRELKTSFGNVYELKLTTDETDITDGNKAISYAYSSSPIDGKPYTIFLAERINDLDNTMRINKHGKREPAVVWLEHRNNGAVQKIYPQIYDNYSAKKGELFEFSATIYTGLLNNPD